MTPASTSIRIERRDRIGAQDDVAQLLVFGDEGAQRRDGHLDDLAGVAHDGRQIDARARQQVELAKEAVGTVDGDHAVLGAVALDDRHDARLDHEEVIAGVAVAEEHLPGLDLAHLPERAQPRALLLTQPGEGPVTVLGLLHADAEGFAHAESSSTNATSSR